MVQFQQVSPEQIDFLPPEAIKYLENAIKRTPGSTSRLDITLDIAKKGNGEIFLIYDGELIGATYIIFYNTPEGKVLCVALLGGNGLFEWRDAYYEFATGLARSRGANAIRYIGRDGWGKAFPMCKRIGSIFELKL